MSWALNDRLGRFMNVTQLPVDELNIRYDTIEEFNVDSKAEYTA